MIAVLELPGLKQPFQFFRPGLSEAKPWRTSTSGNLPLADA
jgi:hypothetical protein